MNLESWRDTPWDAYGGGSAQPEGRVMSGRQGLHAASGALTAAVIAPPLGLGLVAPAVAAIGASLSDPGKAVSVVVVPYLLGYAASVLSAGMLADRFGARRVQLWGLALFVVASLSCAVARASFVLAPGRF